MELECLFFLMIRRPPRSTRTDTLFPCTPLFRSLLEAVEDRGDPPLAEPHPRPHSPRLQLLAAGVGGLLEERDAGLAPQLLAQEVGRVGTDGDRSEEHTSELQSLMRISYAVFCLKNNQQPIPSS